MSLCSWAVSVTITTAPQGDLGHFCHCTDCQSNCGAPCVAYGIFADTAVSTCQLFSVEEISSVYLCIVFLLNAASGAFDCVCVRVVCLFSNYINFIYVDVDLTISP